MPMACRPCGPSSRRTVPPSPSAWRTMARGRRERQFVDEGQRWHAAQNALGIRCAEFRAAIDQALRQPMPGHCGMAGGRRDEVGSRRFGRRSGHKRAGRDGWRAPVEVPAQADHGRTLGARSSACANSPSGSGSAAGVSLVRPGNARQHLGAERSGSANTMSTPTASGFPA